MGPIYSPNKGAASSAPTKLSEESRRLLCRVAREAIEKGLSQHDAWQPVPTEYPEELRQFRSTFITLHLGDRLRGCIGALEATRSLVEDVAEHAYASAFRDPRFAPLQADELSELRITISVLSRPEALSFSSEEDLLQKVRPGIDGLILKEGMHRGTLLPSVWKSLPDPIIFLRHLKEKAGLSPDYWSESITIDHYTTESFSDEFLFATMKR